MVNDDELVGFDGEEVAMRQPTLFLTVGLPATGKTSTARRLEVDHHALRLTKDEWMKALYGEQNPSSASDVIEGRLVEIGLRVLELGINVVIDFGLWGRDERSALRQAAADRGASVEMHYFEVSSAEQRRRLDQRQADEPHTTWPISDEELLGWVDVMQIPTQGEVDGSEPIDDPPAGFESWDDWRGDRWPHRLHDRFPLIECPWRQVPRKWNPIRERSKAPSDEVTEHPEEPSGSDNRNGTGCGRPGQLEAGPNDLTPTRADVTICRSCPPCSEPRGKLAQPSTETSSSIGRAQAKSALACANAL